MKQLLLTWLKAGHLSIPKLLLKNYTKLHLNETELVTMLQLYSFIEEGHLFPTPDELAEHLTCTPTECADILQQLLKKRLIRIQELVDDSGVLSESYSFDPLWERLTFLLIEKKEQAEVADKEETESNVYTLFEKEFSRPLSPMECELLTIWLDQENYSYELIKAALREAVISGKRSFRYIDRILFEWKKNGVKTPEQARSYSEKFRKYQQRTVKKAPEPNHEFPTYNWLEQ